MDHVKTYRAGEAGYYATRTRGTVDIWHDSRRYVYLKPNDIKQFKREAVTAWEDGGRCTARISGAYPSYTIETEA